MWKSEKGFEQEFLLITVCASTILTQLQLYIDKITQVCVLQKSKEDQKQKDIMFEKDTLKQL